jgi:bifunctional DNA-binding transcriptional regulator/antitoxin component of YhaV-PrlF toxin-antitoxin module
MPTPKYIKEVTYEIEAQMQGGRFSIPKEVLDSLGLTTSDRIRVVISELEKPHKVIFDDEIDMRSGAEIYGKRIKEVAKSKQRLRVTVSKPNQL